MAKRLGLGARTLQRRLRECGLAYNDIVEQMRQQKAYRHLRHEALQISEIAFRLGYSEVSAFDRAFRRWSGTSPLAFRQAARRGN
ncbi:MAG: helix-turn-helix transcriptional regulator [Kiloniellales bacterium]|nr:helix-turn-helix transcriptional regulator [Kiloniellales bacterium]MDJ0968270.1 helix-turn-helix transcriptional regulator [Kiloniellales bacterium]